MWELDCKESWTPKNWRFWTVVLEQTLESPLDCEEIKLVHPKGDQSWLFIGRIDVEAETPIPWPADVKSWLIGKDPDAGRDWGQEEKGMTEDEMVEWHHSISDVTDSMDKNLGKLREIVKDRETWCAAGLFMEWKRVKVQWLNKNVVVKKKVWYNFCLLIHWDLFWNIACDLAWKLFQVPLKRICIVLFLDGFPIDIS